MKNDLCFLILVLFMTNCETKNEACLYRNSLDLFDPIRVKIELYDCSDLEGNWKIKLSDRVRQESGNFEKKRKIKKWNYTTVDNNSHLIEWSNTCKNFLTPSSWKCYSENDTTIFFLLPTYTNEVNHYFAVLKTTNYLGTIREYLDFALLTSDEVYDSIAPSLFTIQDAQHEFAYAEIFRIDKGVETYVYNLYVIANGIAYEFVMVTEPENLIFNRLIFFETLRNNLWNNDLLILPFSGKNEIQIRSID